LVAEAGAETDEEVAETDGEVAETVAVLVDGTTDVPVDKPAEELADEAVDVVLVVVLVHKELTESGTVTPAVVQICFAYSTAVC
jgi:hypothetical protein